MEVKLMKVIIKHELFQLVNLIKSKNAKLIDQEMLENNWIGESMYHNIDL